MQINRTTEDFSTSLYPASRACVYRNEINCFSTGAAWTQALRSEPDDVAGHPHPRHPPSSPVRIHVCLRSEMKQNQCLSSADCLRPCCQAESFGIDTSEGRRQSEWKRERCCFPSCHAVKWTMALQTQQRQRKLTWEWTRRNAVSGEFFFCMTAQASRRCTKLVTFGRATGVWGAFKYWFCCWNYVLLSWSHWQPRGFQRLQDHTNQSSGRDSVCSTWNDLRK